MSPRVRILTLVWLTAAAAAAVVIGATLLQSQDSSASADADLPEGNPPLLLDLGLRQDPEARDLARGARLYGEGNLEAAGRVFARYRSVDARVARRSPAGRRGRSRSCRRSPPSSPGTASSGSTSASRSSGRAARRMRRPPGGRRVPSRRTRSPPSGPATSSTRASRRGCRFRARPAARGGRAASPGRRALPAPRATGVRAARVRRGPPHARRSAGARRCRGSPLRQGQSVRGLLAPRPAGPALSTCCDRPVHLGLLLLWMGQVDEAKAQLRQAKAIAPDDPLGREADRFLNRLESIENQ